MAGSAAGHENGQPGEWAGEVIPLEELAALLARFGMIVGLDSSRDADKELQAAQLAHALVGAAEAHATRAEQAYRDAGAEPGDIVQASLMAFAGVNCECESDELALIMWRATRLAGTLGALDFAGPLARQGEIGSGDALIRTMSLVAAALSGMATAAQASANPQRRAGESATAGQALAKAMSALEEASSLAAGASTRPATSTACLPSPPAGEAGSCIELTCTAQPSSCLPRWLSSGGGLAA